MRLSLPWALAIEPAHRGPAQAAGYETATTFHPTFLYESLWNLTLVWALLWIDRRGWLRRGSLFLLYLIGYGLGRFWIELLRIDTVERYLGLSRNNWVALAAIVVGTVGLLLWERRDRRAADEPDGDAAGQGPDTDAKGRAQPDAVTPMRPGHVGPQRLHRRSVIRDAVVGTARHRWNRDRRLKHGVQGPAVGVGRADCGGGACGLQRRRPAACRRARWSVGSGHAAGNGVRLRT